MILTSIFKRADGTELDRWADFPLLLAVGDTVPARGFKPSDPKAKRPMWHITDKVTDYRNSQVTYIVEPIA